MPPTCARPDETALVDNHTALRRFLIARREARCWRRPRKTEGTLTRGHEARCRSRRAKTEAQHAKQARTRKHEGTNWEVPAHAHGSLTIGFYPRGWGPSMMHACHAWPQRSSASLAAALDQHTRLHERLRVMTHALWVRTWARSATRRNDQQHQCMMADEASVTAMLQRVGADAVTARQCAERPVIAALLSCRHLAGKHQGSLQHRSECRCAARACAQS